MRLGQVHARLLGRLFQARQAFQAQLRLGKVGAGLVGHLPLAFEFLAQGFQLARLQVEQLLLALVLAGQVHQFLLIVVHLGFMRAVAGA